MNRLNLSQESVNLAKQELQHFHLWFEQIKYSFQRVNGPLYQFLFDNVNTTGFEGSALVSFKIICDDILERYLFKSLSQDVYTVIRRENARGHDALLLIQRIYGQMSYEDCLYFYKEHLKKSLIVATFLQARLSFSITLRSLSMLLATLKLLLLLSFWIFLDSRLSPMSSFMRINFSLPVRSSRLLISFTDVFGLMMRYPHSVERS